MNKLINAFVVASCVFMFACDSAQPIIPEEPSAKKLYDVSLNLGGFQDLSKTTARASAVPFNQRAKYLYYAVYEEKVKMLYAQGGREGNPVGTNLDLKLANGDYTISLVMAEKSQKFQFKSDIEDILTVDEQNWFYYDDLTVDVFFGTFKIKVDGKNETQNVTLTRPIGQIKLAINDLNLAPAEVKTITPVLVGWGHDDDKNIDVREISVPQGIKLNQRSFFHSHYNPLSIDVLPYNSVRIPRANFSLFNASNPISFYLPQLINVDPPLIGGYKPAGFDLYLQGSKDDNVQLELASPNIAFMKLLKKGFTLSPQQSITITGSVFDSQGLSVQINEAWDNTEITDF